MKNARQAEILNIVQTTEVETQEQLLSCTKGKRLYSHSGHSVRDIKELLPGEGAHRPGEVPLCGHRPEKLRRDGHPAAEYF